jgi:hypothetical protein
MKPKEWLLKHGHITEIGRGRISLPNKALIEEAVRNGAVIEGYSVSTAPSKEGSDNVAKVEKTPKAGAIFDVPDEARSEDMWRAFRAVDNVEVGMRTVCNGPCGSSLTYCRCEHPRVWVDHQSESLVYFKPIAQKGHRD